MYLRPFVKSSNIWYELLTYKLLTCKVKYIYIAGLHFKVVDTNESILKNPTHLVNKTKALYIFNTINTTRINNTVLYNSYKNKGVYDYTAMYYYPSTTNLIKQDKLKQHNC